MRAATLVRTATQKRILKERGFEHLTIWPGAVDTGLFRPRGKGALCLPRPIAMYMGRVAVEKGLDAFLDLDLPGSKVVVGGGPDLEKLRGAYPHAHFLGPKFGEELAGLLSAADVFVFPSKTDTLGLVMLEAMACGVPVVASDIGGVREWLRPNETGVLVPPKDPDALAAGMRQLLNDSDLNLSYGRNGLALVRERFSRDFHVVRLLERYSACLEGKEARRAAS